MEPITRGSDGADFIKADLHIHTPGSHDYKVDISAEALVEKFLDNDLDLVAITDHDTDRFYPEIREAVDGQDVTVLPGVEITTAQGGVNQIHVTAIFPPEKYTEITPLLSTIGINPKERGQGQADHNIKRICEEVLDRGGLPILAHIDEKSGADYELEGAGKIKEKIFDTEHVAAIEVVYPETKEKFPDFAAIRSSDAHSPDQLGRGATYVKMTEPSFEGLRTAFSDPESRLSLSPPTDDHATITGVRCDGCFLSSREVQFNSHLNCLIGGKGTGKSTVLEHIRYAFDIEPKTERIRDDYESLIESTLGDGGEVEVQIRTEDGERYAIKREYGESPRIVRDDGSEFDVSINSFRSEFFDVEMYSQGELLELARDQRDQLELIDSYVEFDGLKTERKELKDELGKNAEKIARLKNKEETLADEIEDIDAIEENLRLMEERGIKEHVENQEEWEEEETRLTRYQENVTDAVSSVQDIQFFDTLEIDEEVGDSPNDDIVTDITAAMNETVSDLSDLHTKMIERTKKLEETVNKRINEWESRKETREKDYEEISETIASETDVDVDKYFDLKDRLNRLKSKERTLADVRSKLEECKAERTRLLAELQRIRERITDTRRAVIDRLNESLEDVQISLQANANRDEYQEWFQRILKGSYANKDHRDELTATFSPRELVKHLQERNVEVLTKRASIPESTVQKILDFDGLWNKIHELETKEVYDAPKIEIKDRTTWKSLEQMSDGQRCTALLSIAMLERSAPLVVDQPEDMLDNEHVYSTIVSVIKEIKSSRQLLVATHNANIPVLGDAEQIVVMFSNGTEGYFQERGSIDDENVREKAQDILEGGEKAFGRRNEKYGSIV